MDIPVVEIPARTKSTVRFTMASAFVTTMCTSGCGLVIGEQFEGYSPERTQQDGAADATASMSDGGNQDDGASEREPESGPPGVEEDRSDGAVLADAAVSSALVVPLGRDGGCSGLGTPYARYTFDPSDERALKGWSAVKADSALATIALAPEVGSAERGSLKLHFVSSGPNQTGRVERHFDETQTITCISARVFIPRGSVMPDLSRFPGSWLLIAYSDRCYTQSGPDDRPAHYRFELTTHDVWYELAYDTARFADFERLCQLDRSAITEIGVGVGNNLEAGMAGSHDVYIDDVTLWH